jgi:hypothetical protein
MSRHRLFVFSLLIVSSVVACGPDPIAPRALPGPPREATPSDAGVSPTPPPRESPGAGGEGGAAPEAGVRDAIDSASKRAELPTPDAGDGPSVADAGDDTPTPDAGDDATSPADTTSIDAGVETVAARAPVAGEIAIVEALVNPTGTDAGREWIEIVSLANEPLDLSDLHVADAAVDVAVPAGTVQPGARIVLGQSTDASKNGGAPVSVAYGTRIGLNNDGEDLSICVGPCAAGAVIDHVAWKTLGAAYDGHALVFDREANLVCPATQPFGTAGDFGTPAAANDACPVPDAGF